MAAFWAARTTGEKRMLILCILVAVIAVPYAMTPSGGSGKQLLRPLSARQQYKEAANKKSLLQKDTERLKPEIAKLVYTDPPEILIPKIVKLLRIDEQKAGIHIHEIKPLRAKSTDNVTKQSLTLSFTSDFGKAVPFFYLLDDPTGKIVVEKFDVSAADPKSHQVSVEAQIALYTMAADTGDNSSS